jgi:hypothetical protein
MNFREFYFHALGWIEARERAEAALRAPALRYGC